jgi:hypothetical protein
MKQQLLGTITISSETDIYEIFEVEGVFGVTSKRGLDTIGNGVSFKTIEKAINYVNKSIREND